MQQRFDYIDPAFGTRGWLMFHGGEARLSVGGCRVQAGLTPQRLAALAVNMTRKQRVLGLHVDGAKCGLDLAPESPHKREILARFLAFLGPHLAERFSMGCDMGTTFAELERLAAAQGLPSVKHAIASAQGLTEAAYDERIAVLRRPVGAMTLGERRAGHALAHAAIAAARHAPPGAAPTYAVQGFGTLGRAAAYSLHEAGMTVVAVADRDGCVVDGNGLDVIRMLELEPGGSVSHAPVPGTRCRADELFHHPAGTLLLAATEHSMSRSAAAVVAAGAVVVGANCGLCDAALSVLERRRLLVVPDFVGGAGGSASMEALFGPHRAPLPHEVLATVERMMVRLVDELVVQAARAASTVTAAALARVRTTVASAALTPYGHSPLRCAAGAATTSQPRGGLVAVAPSSDAEDR